MFFQGRPYRVEDCPQNVLGCGEQRAFADRLSIRSEFLVERVDVDDETESAESAVSEFVRRDPKMPIDDIDEAAIDVNEEAVTSPEFVRLAGEKILVSFGVSRNSAQARYVDPVTMFARHRHVRVLRRRHPFRTRLRQLDHVFAENPGPEQTFSLFARNELGAV